MITPCIQATWNSSTVSWIWRPGEWVWLNGDTLSQTRLLMHPFLCDLTCVCWYRGRLVYQLTLSLWRLLCLCYCADARLEVLKLTKHIEEGTIKARWRIRGLPFHTLLLRFYQKDKSHLYRCVWTGTNAHSFLKLSFIKCALLKMLIFQVMPKT